MLSAAVDVRQTAAQAADSVVWGLHNPHATKKLLIAKIALRAFFDGTAEATNMKYEVFKALTVTAFSGGTLVTPVKKHTGFTPFAVARVGDTGLTVTGITALQKVAELVMGRVTQTTTNFQAQVLELEASRREDKIELGPNEILVIRNKVTSVVGDSLVGRVDWSENE